MQKLPLSTSKLRSIPLAMLLFAGTVAAQGDDCGTATGPIAGFGFGSYTTTPFTSSGFNGGGFCDVGADTINQDSFWQWTADATTAGDILIDTFGSTFDTKLSVHAGIGCMATCTEYNDDFGGGTQSAVILTNVVAGDTFLFQFGGFGNGQGNLVFNISSTDPDPCMGAMDDAFEDNDDCTTATALTDGTYPALFVSKADKDHYAFSVADGATVHCDILHIAANGDVDGFLRAASSTECGSGNGTDELADGFSGSDDENISWTNTTGACLDVVLEVNAWDDASNPDCITYDLVITGSQANCGDTITTICDPQPLNCAGFPTNLDGVLSGSVLTLDTSQGPPTEFGYYLTSLGMNPGIMVSRGNLCLSDATNGFERLNLGAVGGPLNSLGSFDGGGDFQVATTTADFTVPATMPSGATYAGATAYFQMWHRDSCSAGGSNFSNGLCVTFP